MREEECAHLVCWSRWRRWRSSGWSTLPPLLCSFFCFPLLSLLVLEMPKAVATVSVTFLCLCFFFVCVSPGFPSPVRFPLLVLPVSLPASLFLSPCLLGDRRRRWYMKVWWLTKTSPTSVSFVLCDLSVFPLCFFSYPVAGSFSDFSSKRIPAFPLIFGPFYRDPAACL